MRPRQEGTGSHRGLLSRRGALASGSSGKPHGQEGEGNRKKREVMDFRHPMERN